jgi:hypothetical protein
MDGGGVRLPVMTELPVRAVRTGSPSLAPLMLSLGRLLVTRLVLVRGRRGDTARG